MTKTHFEAVAKMYRDTYVDPDTEPRVALREHAEMMADYFASENPRFNREQFLTACGL